MSPFAPRYFSFSSSMRACGQLQQRFVLRQRFRVRVLKIGQQAEAQIVVPIGQEPDFQRLDQILDVLRAR